MSASEFRITAGELAARLGGRVSGDAARVVRDVGVLETAGPETLSWIGSLKLRERLAASAAGVVVAPEDCTAPERTLILVRDPDAAIIAALALFARPVEQVPAGVDPAARVAPDAVVNGAGIGPHVFVGAGSVVGAGTQLHPGVYVGRGCRIGRDCRLWPNVVLRDYTVLGDRVVIHPNTTLGADGFGYAQRGGQHHKIPQIGAVLVEDDVEIGANTCIDRARTGVTRIGRGTKIDNLVQIAHNVQIGEHCIVVSQCGISGSSTLGHHAVLAGQVGVVDHVNIGALAQVGAQSGVHRDVPDGARICGSPPSPDTEWARQMIGIKKLPRLLEELRALTKRVKALESATHDPE